MGGTGFNEATGGTSWVITQNRCPRTLTGTENVITMLGKIWGKEVGKKEGDEMRWREKMVLST